MKDNSIYEQAIEQLKDSYGENGRQLRIAEVKSHLAVAEAVRSLEATLIRIFESKEK